jgi:hypothetical protein
MSNAAHICRLQDGIPGGAGKAFCNAQSGAPATWITLCRVQRSILPTCGAALQHAEGVASNMDHTLRGAAQHPWEQGGRPAVRSC